MGTKLSSFRLQFRRDNADRHSTNISHDEISDEEYESAVESVELIEQSENDGTSTPRTPFPRHDTCSQDLRNGKADCQPECPLSSQSPHSSSTGTVSITTQAEPTIPLPVTDQPARRTLRKGPIGENRLLEIAQAIGDQNLLKLGIQLKINTAQIDQYKATNRMDGRVTEKGTFDMLCKWAESVGFDQHERLFKALDASGLVAIAEEFLMSDEDDHDDVHKLGEDPHDSCSFTTRFRKEVSRYYLDDYCCIMADPWEDGDHATTSLDDYFVQMSLYKEVNDGEIKKIPLAKSHNQLFDPRDDGTKPPRILVFGEGGTGKSTLCKKLAYDWAKRTADSPLKDVPVLCVVEFRKLQESENIVDAIHSQLLPKDSDITPDHIRKYIKSNPSKVIIVLDGFDEFDPDTHQGDIKHLLSSKIMADVTVLVTTRPWHACLLQKKKRMYVQICLEGFDDRGIDCYVRQYFRVKKDVNKCLSVIRSSLVMLQFARIPILLLMICFLQKICYEDSSQVDTLDSLFEKFLRAIFINYLQKDEDVSYQQYASISPENVETEDLKKFWHNLGELALNGILIPGKKLTFSLDDIRGKEHFCELGLKIGILNRQKIPLKKLHALESPRYVFFFRHFLFQEKCAGDLLASQNDRLESVLHGISSISQALSLQYTLAFCSGQKVDEGNRDNRERARTILCRLSEIQIDGSFTPDLSEDGLTFSQEELTVKRYHRESLFLLSIMINYESQGEGALLEDIMKLDREEVTPSTQTYDGMLYEYLQYFLRFAVRNTSITLCRRYSLEFSHKVGKIKLFDLLFCISKVYREVESVLCTTAVDAKVPIPNILPYSQLGDRMSNIGKLGIVDHLFPPYAVNFSDLLHCISQLGVTVGHVHIHKCSVDLCHRERTQDGEKKLSKEQSHLRYFTIEAAEEYIDVKELLSASGKDCLDLEVLELEECGLSFPALERQSFFTTFCSKTYIRQLNITYIPDIVPFLNLIVLTASCCPSLKILKLTQTELDVPTMHELQNARFENKSSIEELIVGFVHGPIQILDFLHVIALLCPRLKKCGLYDVGLYTPYYETLFEKTFHVKTHIEDLEIMDFLSPPELPMGVVSMQSLPVSTKEYGFNNLDWLVLTGMLCPNLHKLKVGGKELEVCR